jgi:hypothetical protein
LLRHEDRVTFAELPSADAHALEEKLDAATRGFRNRSSCLKPHEGFAILKRLADFAGDRREHLARVWIVYQQSHCFIARESLSAMRSQFTPKLTGRGAPPDLLAQYILIIFVLYFYPFRTKCSISSGERD